MDSPLPLSRLDGQLDYWPRFLALPEQAALYERLAGSLAWDQEELVIAGRTVRVPRLVAWYGEPEAHYRYSGADHPPQPWTPELAELRRRVEAATGRGYNSVLANWYRDGQDSMGWHADKEPELGRDPTIASVSLGAKRRFLIEHVRTGQRLELDLGEGDLLLMAGPTQHHWRHALPKTRKPCGPRINLTFRFIHPGDAS